MSNRLNSRGDPDHHLYQVLHSDSDNDNLIFLGNDADFQDKIRSRAIL